METRKAFWRKPSGFSVPTLHCGWEMRFFNIVENFFENLSLTLHYRGFESRLGEKTQNFFENFSVHTHHWRSIACLAENFWIFLSSLATGHKKCVWSPIMKNSFRYSYWEMGEAFWRRIPKLCPYTSQRTWEVRLGEKIGNFFEFFLFPFSTGGEMPKWSAFRKFFLLHLHGKNVNPLSSTTHWRKSHCLNEKRMLLSESFSHWSIWTGKG